MPEAAPGEAIAGDPGAEPAGELTEGAVEGVEEEAPPPAARLVLPSFNGPVGLFRMSSAETGPLKQLRMGFHGEYASADNFLIQNDSNQRLAGSLALSISPIKPLELFAAILASTNRNDRGNEAGRVDPPIIRAFGDLVLGAKVASEVASGLHAGAEFGVRLFASNEGIAFKTDATSFWFSGLATVDFRTMNEIPLRIHANLGYYVDNSSSLQVTKFDARTLGSKAVSSFAYGIGYSRLRGALGIDAPLEKLGPGIALLPFLEYHGEIVTADADPDFAQFLPPFCKGSSPTAGVNARECSENRDQHWLALGLRVQAMGGFTLDAGVELGLRPIGFPFGTALPPFNLVMGVSFPFDFAPSGPPKIVTKTVTVEKVVEKEPLPKDGLIIGKVVNARGGTPIAGAIIGVVGQVRARVATDLDGSFATKGLPPGPVDVEISAPEFEAQIVKANVVIGQSAEIAATLNPRETRARVHGRILDEAGKALTASIKIQGPANADLAADATGRFWAELPAGAYVAQIQAPNFPAREERFELVAGIERSIDIVFRKGGAAAPALAPGATGAIPAAQLPAVSFENGKLFVRRPVGFRLAGDQPTAELLPAARQTLDEVASVLASTPEIKKLRVEAHWDNALDKAQAEELTKQQAIAIHGYLTKKGVDAGRLQVAGMGSAKPRVPNLGPASRAKNRRIEFLAQ